MNGTDFKNIQTIEKLYAEHTASDGELKALLSGITDGELEFLRQRARQTADEVFGRKIYIRGLIEISSRCKNDCRYCGIRRSNSNAVRYRLSREQILDCCRQGYELGFRTFVLQGGEDLYFNDERMCGIVSEIKREFPDCAVTLSLGERSRQSYENLYKSGADRYLLRHETADERHYRRLHPDEMSFENRINCLYNLKEIGYQTGAGFMVGSPYQTVDCLVKDLKFIERLRPQMCGIGPFIPHRDTEFGGYPSGSVRLVLALLSVIRLMNPRILLPATTALGTADPLGREKGILHGANVLMPNLSPAEHRKDYSLYDNKICTGDEVAQSITLLAGRMRKIGYEITVDRGDFVSI